MTKYLGLAFLLVFLILGTKESCRYNECNDISECQIIKADCCGCRQGGSQIAVPKSEAKSMLAKMKAKCQNKVCLQVISTDPSCQQELSCEDHKCVLK